MPSSFGKSLIIQLVPFVVDSLEEVSNGCVLVVFPLNQIEKLKKRGVGVKVFKQGNDQATPFLDDGVKICLWTFQGV